MDRQYISRLNSTYAVASFRLAWLCAAAVCSAPLHCAEAGIAPPALERRAALTGMVRQDCGSCHGMTLKGGLGPALTPAALTDRPAESLVVTILSGRPGTAMPPWRNFLSADEAAWIVDQLQRGVLDEK